MQIAPEPTPAPASSLAFLAGCLVGGFMGAAIFKGLAALCLLIGGAQ